MAAEAESPEEAARWLAPIEPDLPLAVAEARAQLAPALGSDFKRLVAPTLALVAPAGMSREDQRAWLATAAETLSGIPADLLERGCRAVRRAADHPSKIVAGIFAEVEDAWERRKADLAAVVRMEHAAREPSVQPDAAAADLVDPAELKRLQQGIAERMAAREPPRAPGMRFKPTEQELAQVAERLKRAVNGATMPTVADYVALGLSQEDAERAVVERPTDGLRMTEEEDAAFVAEVEAQEEQERARAAA